MEVNDLRALSTVLAFTAFIGIVWWAWQPQQPERLREAARCRLPTTSITTAQWEPLNERLYERFLDYFIA